ncbi:MAG TPA: hypothetical protein EYP59_15865 [Thiotrichaceae bacterium]|nr:hypothetical protein [Thiotrichaceae bacterium]
MFELKISNLNQARHLSQYWATHTVSLLDPDFVDDGITKCPIASQDGNLRRYYFHDIEPRYKDHFLPLLGGKAVIASRQQMQEILEFTASLKSTDKLLVHCHAGMSRSTAVACAVLCQHGLTPIEAVKHVVSIRPIAMPNRHLLKLLDDLLGLDGKLVVAGTEELFMK